MRYEDFVRYEVFDNKLEEIECKIVELRELASLTDAVKDFLLDVKLDERLPKDVREKAEKLFFA